MTSPAAIKLSVRLQDVASSLADVLDDIAGEPIPFVLVLQAGGVAQYVSNVERKDGRDLIESLIERWDAGRADIPAHMNPDLPKGAAPEPPAQQPHPDDAAVDAFAAAMKSKLAEARAKGRGGWQDKKQCSQQYLSTLLRDHVRKGDPRDVANFCCFLWNRGEGIAAAQPMTDREANNLADDHLNSLSIELIRAVEAFHGIGKGESK